MAKSKRVSASKSQLLSIYKAHKQAEQRNLKENTDNVSRATILVTLGILIQMFDFTPEDCEYFVDTFEEVLQNVRKGVEDVDSIASTIEEYCGIKVCTLDFSDVGGL